MMGRRIRDHALSLLFFGLFAASLAGQAVAGFLRNGEELAEHGARAVGFGEFLASSDFVVDVAENWQSEFLQFFLFIAATIWLIQRGSPESKKPGHEGVGDDAEQLMGEHARADSPAGARSGRWRSILYGNSLLIVMGAVFLLAWLAQSLGGLVVMNELNALHGRAELTWPEYVVSADFWNRTLQNWQSEFLAVGAMIGFSIYLRQRGSSESKPVGAPHAVSSWESE